MFTLSIFIEKHDSWIEKFTELGVRGTAFHALLQNTTMMKKNHPLR